MSASPVAAALAGRCPACGEGRLFDGYLRVRPRCEVCGLDLSAEDSGDGPVAFIILIVGGIVVAALALVEIRYQPPIWLHLLIWLPLTVVCVLALLRPAKAILIGLQYRHRHHDFGSPP